MYHHRDDLLPIPDCVGSRYTDGPILERTLQMAGRSVLPTLHGPLPVHLAVHELPRSQEAGGSTVVGAGTHTDGGATYVRTPDHDLR